jgi:ABC-type amino acid transport substrate-binding protein
MKTLFGFAFLILVVFAPSSYSKSITIGVENINYYPLYAYDESVDVFTGYVPELFDTFGELYGYQITYKALPIKRLYKMFYSGEIDAKFPDSDLWNQESRLDYSISYSTPIIELEEVMFVQPKDKELKLDGFRKLGVVSGMTPWKLFPVIETGQVKVLEAENPELLLEMVFKGRVQGVVMDRSVGSFLLSQMDDGLNLAINTWLLESEGGSYHLSNINNPELIADFNAFLSTHAYQVRKIQIKYGISNQPLGVNSVQ